MPGSRFYGLRGEERRGEESRGGGNRVGPFLGQQAREYQALGRVDLKVFLLLSLGARNVRSIAKFRARLSALTRRSTELRAAEALEAEDGWS